MLTKFGAAMHAELVLGIVGCTAGGTRVVWERDGWLGFRCDYLYGCCSGRDRGRRRDGRLRLGGAYRLRFKDRSRCMHGDRLGLGCGSNNRLWFRLRIGYSSRFGYGNRFRFRLGRRLQLSPAAHAEHIALVDGGTALRTRRRA